LSEDEQELEQKVEKKQKKSEMTNFESIKALTKQAHIESVNASKSHDEKKLEKKQKKAKISEKITLTAPPLSENKSSK